MMRAGSNSGDPATDLEKHGLISNVPKPNAGEIDKPPPRKATSTTIAAVVAFYFVISMAVVLLNKFIFSYSAYVFPYPLFVTWFQLVVALICIIVWGELGKSFPSIALMPPFELSWAATQSVFSLTVVYILMIVFNNLCLKYVEVSFYQVARSLTIVFNVIFTYTILGQTTSSRAMKACGVVIFGYVLGSVTEMKFTFLGLGFGLLSSIFVALYSIYVKRGLKVFNEDQWKLLMYNTALASVLLFPVVLIGGELPSIQRVTFLNNIEFWAIMTFTAICGFLINIAIFLQIKVTTPLTNNISGTAKACLQTVIGVILFNNPMPTMNAVGTAICILGSALYSYIRYAEMTASRS